MGAATEVKGSGQECPLHMRYRNTKAPVVIRGWNQNYWTPPVTFNDSPVEGGVKMKSLVEW